MTLRFRHLRALVITVSPIVKVRSSTLWWWCGEDIKINSVLSLFSLSLVCNIQCYHSSVFGLLSEPVDMNKHYCRNWNILEKQRLNEWNKPLKCVVWHKLSVLLFDSNDYCSDWLMCDLESASRWELPATHLFTYLCDNFFFLILMSQIVCSIATWR